MVSFKGTKAWVHSTTCPTYRTSKPLGIPSQMRHPRHVGPALARPFQPPRCWAHAVWASMGSPQGKLSSDPKISPFLVEISFWPFLRVSLEVMFGDLFFVLFSEKPEINKKCIATSGPNYANPWGAWGTSDFRGSDTPDKCGGVSDKSQYSH